MNGYEIYKKYCGLKSHFTIGCEYDFVRYNGAVKTNRNTYEKRKDKKYFEYLSKRFQTNEIIPFLLANFVNNETKWIGEFSTNFEESEFIFVKWKKKYEALTQTFTDDIKNIRRFLGDKDLKFIDLFDVTKQKHPAIFRFLLYDMISIETFIILNDIEPFYEHFDKVFSDDPLWVQWKFRCVKYRLFINFNVDKMKNITKKLFT